jgi:hypothetical protein
MASVLSKTFDMQHGAVFLQVQDGVLGNTSPNTIYVSGMSDYATQEAALLTEIDAQATALKNGMMAAGWTESAPTAADLPDATALNPTDPTA